MKKLQIISVVCLLFAIWHNYFGESCELLSIAAQCVGLALVVPALLTEKSIEDIKENDKVFISYWKRINIGTEAESMEIFDVEGRISKIANMGDTKRLIIVDEGNRERSLLISQISKIKFYE